MLFLAIMMVACCIALAWWLAKMLDWLEKTSIDYGDDVPDDYTPGGKGR